MEGKRPARKREDAGLHAGHRLRVKNRFLRDGLDRFEPHEVLELLLYYAVPQGDTNPTAHRLLQKFGSIDRVLEAPIEELQKVKGIGPSAATLLRMIPAYARVYLEAKAMEKGRAYSIEEAAQLLIPKFVGRTKEAVAVLLLNSKGVPLYTGIVAEGSIHVAPIYVRDIIQLAINYGADTLILAHNHPSGNAAPSAGDIMATKEVLRAAESVNVTLGDHLIVAGEDFTSFRKSGWLQALREEEHRKNVRIDWAALLPGEEPERFGKRTKPEEHGNCVAEDAKKEEK